MKWMRIPRGLFVASTLICLSPLLHAQFVQQSEEPVGWSERFVEACEKSDTALLTWALLAHDSYGCLDEYYLELGFEEALDNQNEAVLELLWERGYLSYIIGHVIGMEPTDRSLQSHERFLCPLPSSVQGTLVATMAVPRYAVSDEVVAAPMLATPRREVASLEVASSVAAVSEKTDLEMAVQALASRLVVWEEYWEQLVDDESWSEIAASWEAADDAFREHFRFYGVWLLGEMIEAEAWPEATRMLLKGADARTMFAINWGYRPLEDETMQAVLYRYLQVNYPDLLQELHRQRLLKADELFEAQDGLKEFCRVLVEKGYVDEGIWKASGIGGEMKLKRRLLSVVAKCGFPPDRLELQYMAPLELALEEGQDKMVKALLRMGSDPTPLMLKALDDGDLELFDLAVRYGANPAKLDWNPDAILAEYGYWPLLEQVWQFVGISDLGRILKAAAAQEDEARLYELLSRFETHPVERTTELALLAQAQSASWQEVSELLLKRLGELDLEDHLDVAIRLGQEDEALSLLREGADPYRKDESGNYLGLKALQMGDFKVIRFLKRKVDELLEFGDYWILMPRDGEMEDTFSDETGERFNRFPKESQALYEGDILDVSHHLVAQQNLHDGSFKSIDSNISGGFGSGFGNPGSLDHYRFVLLHPGADDDLDAVVVSAPGSAAGGLSQFPDFRPWPPPGASAKDLLDDSLLRQPNGVTTLGDVSDALESAFRRGAYRQLVWFRAPGGFALVSRIEQIDADGGSLNAPERWDLDVANLSDSGGLIGIFKRLFAARPGYYRVILFAVTDEALSNQGGQQLTAEEANAWLDRGDDRLPASIARQIFTENHRCYYFIYEFKRPSQDHNLDIDSMMVKDLPVAEPFIRLVQAKLWQDSQ